jgi:hypothetical protein
MPGNFIWDERSPRPGPENAGGGQVGGDQLEGGTLKPVGRPGIETIVTDARLTNAAIAVDRVTNHRADAKLAQLSLVIEASEATLIGSDC